MAWWDFLNVGKDFMGGRLTPASIVGGPAVGALAQGGSPSDAWQAAWGRAPSGEKEGGFWGTFGDVGQIVGPAIATMGASGAFSAAPAAASAGGGAGGGAAIPAGGGTAAGGGAFDAGVMATHGGMSNAAGGAGAPEAYAGAPADGMDPKMAEMFKKLGGIGAGMLGGGGEEAPQRVIPAMRGQAGSPAVFQPSVAPSNAGFYNQVMKMLGK